MDEEEFAELSFSGHCDCCEEKAQVITHVDPAYSDSDQEDDEEYDWCFYCFNSRLDD